MNAKKYRAWLKHLSESNLIPQELYDKMLAELPTRGRVSSKRVYASFFAELEKRRLFDVPVVPYTEKGQARTDGRFKYRHPKNPFWHVWHWFARSVAKFAGVVGGGFRFGVWRIKGKKKIKKLGACITVSNHIDFLDACITERAACGKRRYIVVAPFNCKRTLGGALLKGAGVLPLPVSYEGSKPFTDAMCYALSKKSAIHIYAEQTMWPGYTKPRPLKDGAFYYAERLNLPVVPTLYCYGKPKGLRKLFGLPKITVMIGEPIYADISLRQSERRADFCKRTEQAMAELYEEFYGVPLEYLEPDEPQDPTEPVTDAKPVEGETDTNKTEEETL